jgi:hypothetical protein
MLIAGLVYGIDQHYECMHVIRATQDSALTALAIAQPFDRLVRARGYHDRRTLLNLVENSKQIRDWSVEYIDSYISQADLLAQTFWERFVIDHSQVPEADLDKWRF